MPSLRRLLGRGKRKVATVEEPGHVLLRGNSESFKGLNGNAGPDYGLKVLYQPSDESKAVVE